MSCTDIIVLGEAPDDPINYGESITRRLYYEDEAGNPIDLTSATVEVAWSVPSIIKEAAVLTKGSDGEGNYVEFFLSKDDAEKLHRGRLNRFRLHALFGPHSDDATPEIWINVT